MRLYLATSNAHKIEELRSMLGAASLSIETHSPETVGGMPEVVEDQDTFTGNALKKARSLSALLPNDGWALADDSGLCVDALDGAPGVFSARYAGEGATDRDNLDKLLSTMEAVEAPQRSAYFSCCLAIVSPSGEAHTFEGRCNGRILQAPRGDHGFGYDPVFAPSGFDKSFAEMSEDGKAGLSHRGNALKTLVDWMRGEMPG